MIVTVSLVTIRHCTLLTNVFSSDENLDPWRLADTHHSAVSYTHQAAHSLSRAGSSSNRSLCLLSTFIRFTYTPLPASPQPLPLTTSSLCICELGFLLFFCLFVKNMPLTVSNRGERPYRKLPSGSVWVQLCVSAVCSFIWPQKAL